MGTRALEAARANSIHYLDACLSAIGAGTVASAGPYQEIAHRYHVLGIVALLLDADRDAFAENLARAGQAHLHLLALLDAGAPLDRAAVCTGKAHAFADALASGDRTTAERIATLSPTTHDPEHEYEDDFLQYRFLQLLLLAPDDRPTLEAILARWEVVLEGGPSAMLETARALLDREAGALHQALAALVDERAESLAELRLPDEVAATEGQVFVRGLAVLRLAELLGIGTAPEYRFLPALARVPLRPRPLPADAWRTLP